MGLGRVVREDFLARGIDVSSTREDLAIIDERVRDLAKSQVPATFRDLWPLLVADQGLASEERRDRWEVRAFAELSWFCLRNTDRGFRVWEAAKLRRHLDRLRALRMVVPEHEKQGLEPMPLS